MCGGVLTFILLSSFAVSGDLKSKIQKQLSRFYLTVFYDQITCKTTLSYFNKQYRSFCPLQECLRADSVLQTDYDYTEPHSGMGLPSGLFE